MKETFQMEETKVNRKGRCGNDPENTDGPVSEVVHLNRTVTHCPGAEVLSTDDDADLNFRRHPPPLFTGETWVQFRREPSSPYKGMREAA